MANQYVSKVVLGSEVKLDLTGDTVTAADLKKGVQGQHASNLGGIIAREIGDELGIPSFIADPPVVDEMQAIARDFKVVIPVSYYERVGETTFNTVAVIDADGTIMGQYRKTHIPDDHFYQEKFYFTPGNTGFKVWDTAYAKIGVGICWDQWFPESARCMALQGAELLFYPTAIGSEPILDCDSMPHWRRCMQGHAAANIMPLIAANRIGTETVKPTEDNQHQSSSLTFYGSSFIADETGALVEQADRENAGVLTHTFDLDEIREMRRSWGVYRDRRPEMYGAMRGYGL